MGGKGCSGRLAEQGKGLVKTAPPARRQADRSAVLARGNERLHIDLVALVLVAPHLSLPGVLNISDFLGGGRGGASAGGWAGICGILGRGGVLRQVAGLA